MISESCFSSQCPLLFESTFANNLVSSAVNRDGVRGDCGEGVAIRSKCQFRVCHPQDKKNFGWLRTQIMSTFVRWKEICRTLTSLGFWFFSISKKKIAAPKKQKPDSLTKRFGEKIENQFRVAQSGTRCKATHHRNNSKNQGRPGKETPKHNSISETNPNYHVRFLYFVKLHFTKKKYKTR